MEYIFVWPRDAIREEMYTPAPVMLMGPTPPLTVGTGKISSAGQGSPAGTNSTLCRGWMGVRYIDGGYELLAKSSGNNYSVNNPKWGRQMVALGGKGKHRRSV